jgi:hypothetical protein
MPKYKMGKEKDLTSPDGLMGDGKVYAGGSQYFDERTGIYRPGSPTYPKGRTPRVGKNKPRVGKNKTGFGIIPVRPGKKR